MKVWKLKNIIDRYKPILKKTLTSYINDLVNEKIQIALKDNDSEQDEVSSIELINNDDVEENYDKPAAIITTDDELESFYIVKSILRETIDPSRIFYKDTLSYFGILIDNKVTRWLCRIYLKENINYIIIPDSDKENIKYQIESLDDIYKLSDKLIERVKVLM